MLNSQVYKAEKQILETVYPKDAHSTPLEGGGCQLLLHMQEYPVSFPVQEWWF